MPEKSVAVTAPTAGIITRTPTDQAGRTTNNGCITAASNVRCDQGVLRNAPGYEACDTNIALDSPVNMIFQANLNPDDSIVVDNTVYIGTQNQLYSGKRQFTLPPPPPAITPPADVTATCGLSSNWNAGTFGQPYSNSGNTTSGLVPIYGRTIATNGTQLFLNSTLTFPFQSLTNFPVVAADFIATMTCSMSISIDGAPEATGFGFSYSDSITAQSILMIAAPPYNGSNTQIVSAWFSCNASTNPLVDVNSPFTNLVASARTPVTSVTTGTPFTVKVIKSGSLFLLYVNNIQYLNYDSKSANATGTVGLYVNPVIGSATVSNISIQ